MTISQVVEIPFREASASGGTSTTFEVAELNLTVIPRITPGDRDNPELKLTRDSLVF